ncbi:MAG: LytR C-terminal domain-containing protein [Beutenbergiaceae bacterium]
MNSQYPYPEDEFDHLGADRTPAGVHREPLPWWRRLLPFLIVLVLAPTLAFLAVRALSAGSGSSTAPTATATEQTTVVEQDPSGTAQPPPESESAEPEPTPEVTSAEPTDPVAPETIEADYGTQIWVLNGAGVAGLAADTAQVLEEAGWSDVSPADYSRPQPSETTLYYDNPDQADEAELIGEMLGIGPRIESSDAADGDIVIVLRSDFG